MMIQPSSYIGTMNRIVFALAAWIFVQCASAQLSAVIDLAGIPDTCKIGVDTLYLGKTRKGLVVAPRIEYKGFDVHMRGTRQDTAFQWGPDNARTVHYWICYKVESINSNCPWLSFQRYTPTKCE